MSQAVTTDMRDARDERAGGAGGAGRSTALTRNEAMVLGTLKTADGPLKAYELLAQLKTRGVKAPMTVYRALDRLEGRGLVHKLDGLGAFVVCNHDAPHAAQTFLVCDGCAGVAELPASQDTDAMDPSRLRNMAADSGFVMESARLEIRGRCRDCD